MKVRNLMLSSAFALMGILSACNENPVVEPGNAPANLRASSTSTTSVTLAWDAVAGATSYEVSWVAAPGFTGSGSTSVTTTTALVPSLSEGVMYDFKVRATTASGLGDEAVLRWAPASRHTQTHDAKPIRMYEFASSSPSGLNLYSAADGGPEQVSMVVGRPGVAQLAVYIYDAPGTSNIDSIIVGPAYALIEYRAAHQLSSGKIDTSVYISSGTYNVASLDSWYLSQPLNQLIGANTNVSAYKFTSNSTAGQGFIVRTGTPGNYHYARVVIKSVGGVMVTGPKPNRYIEMEISYQTGADVPFAKAGMPAATIGVMATPGHRVMY